MSLSLNLQASGIKLRPIEHDELDAAHKLELSCYTPEAAASREAFTFRQANFPQYFWSAWNSDEQLVGLACAIRTYASSCEEDEVKGAHRAEPGGEHLCVLSVAVSPSARLSGIGKALMEALLRQAELDKLASVILMCEEHLIPFYEGLTFRYIGPSKSAHGGIAWHEMSRIIE
ncbi:GNAT family N-acetyltransferase [Paenibacillus sp. OV219]|uniref:GNAT family N-acetyltransferase n=1 Tax=Paenibacillus sp. OV219 TaxID=1884377 RepID=UPI0008D712BD|nr:GNAT family N-acetyltransferase [Paenibacillus sp. OV219]SEM85521.1 Acetyltransferase (GNAT) domain-containing protein [Paenibacillus sp. OV219]